MKFGSSTLLSVISCLLTTSASSAFQIHKTLPLQKSLSSSTSLSMVTTGPLHCRPIGIGSAAPSTVITNQDLESVVETSDEWIRTRTGISERRVLLHNAPTEQDDDHESSVSSPPETIKTLASKAAQQALDMSGLDPESIDLVLVATSSPDDMFGDATSVAASLGCKNAMAFDLTAACSGFLFGITTAGQFLTNNDNSFNNAIVVGADALSRWIDWSDRNSCILFGDGAGAVVLQSTEGKGDAGILGSSAHSNGLGYENLNCAYQGTPVTVNTPQVLELSSGSYNNLAMNGNEVYKFATRSVPKVIKEALVAADLEVEDVDWLLLHQVGRASERSERVRAERASDGDEQYHVYSVFPSEL